MLKLHLSPFNIAYRTAVSVIALDASSINCLLTDILDSAPLKPIVDRPLILFPNSDPLNPMADHFLIFFSEFSSSESCYRSSLDLYLFWIQLLWILCLIISWSCSGNCFTASIRPTAWFDSLQFLVTLDIINTPIICLPVSSSRPSISILESLLAGCLFWSILLLWVLDGDLPRSPCWRYSLLDFDRAIFSILQLRLLLSSGFLTLGNSSSILVSPSDLFFTVPAINLLPPWGSCRSCDHRSFDLALYLVLSWLFTWHLHP